MVIETLTKEQIYRMHNQALIKFGGIPGGNEYTDGKIESILAQQYDFFGVDKYPTVFDKAAMLLYFIAKDHCFNDGNKRTALYATTIFLDINGYEPTFTNSQAEQFLYKIAEGKLRGIEIDEYIKRISQVISDNIQAID